MSFPELFPSIEDEKYRDVDVVFDDTNRVDDRGDCRRVIVEAIVVVAAAAAKLAEVPIPSRCARDEE